MGFSQWTLGLLATIFIFLSPGSSDIDVADICTHCTCQYLAASHITDTLCTSDTPILDVNCASKPKVKQNPNSASSTNSSAVVWLSYKNAGLTSLQPFTQFEPFNVTLLALDHNRLVYLPPRALSALRHLTIITASHNDINSVAPDAFKGLRNLRHLDLSHNSLHSVDFSIVFDAGGLVSLDVHNNKIKSISPPEKKIKTLETLDFSANKLTDFPLLMFSSFPNLLKLNISYNNLSVLTADLFHNLNELKVLDASGNEIKSLDNKVVKSLNRLERLYVNENFLTKVEFVKDLLSLKTFSVKQNMISHLGDKTLNSNLQRLIISNNNLTDLTHVFKVFDKLKSLDASWNPCAVFPDRIRAGLRELLLDGTLLTSWPAQRPGEGSINHLSLSQIPGITTLGPYAFSGILKPKTEKGTCVSLEIRNTSLSSVDEDALRDIDICHLDLSSNQLRWLPQSLVNWSALVGVNLQDNPWHCDCALQWLLTTVVPAAYKSDQAMLEELRCASPLELQGVRLVHWYQHGEAALCVKNAGLTVKDRPVPGDPAGRILVTVASSPLMIAVLLGLSLLAVLLVVLGFALQRRAVRLRKMRRNRRF